MNNNKIKKMLIDNLLVIKNINSLNQVSFRLGGPRQPRVQQKKTLYHVKVHERGISTVILELSCD